MDKETNALVVLLERRKKKIAGERDTLRSILEEYSGLVDTCDRAIGDIESAITTLSELV